MRTEIVNPELHFTQLKMMAKSPAHYRAYLDEGFEATAAMNRGTLVHAILLGGDYVVYPKERRGNEWKAFAEENASKLIVTQKEYDVAARAAEAVLEDRVAAPLLKGDHEREWKAAMYGRPCAGRIDVSGMGFTVDLKTTTDAEPHRFKNQALRMGYHAQLAWYADARRALGELPGDLWIIGVEMKAPFAVTVLRVTERCAEEGRKALRLWIERLHECEQSNEWPGYVQSAVDLDIVEDSGLIIDGESVSLDDAA